MTLGMPCAEVLKFPSLELEGEDDCIFRPSLELNEVTPSYLDYLRDEIQRAARGKEWSDILKARLNALLPYKSEKLYSLMILRRHDGYVESCSIRFRPTNLEIVHFECL
jgi:hypothetical protein